MVINKMIYNYILSMVGFYFVKEGKIWTVTLNPGKFNNYHNLVTVTLS